ncbi:hypothetical protein ACF0H5_000459 [Mactra antiquata]
MRSLHRRFGKVILICLIVFITWMLVVDKALYLKHSGVESFLGIFDSSPLDISKRNSEVVSQRLNLIRKNDTTVLNDIFICVKTTKKFHKVRMQVLLDTWISLARNQTYIFTDEIDTDLADKIDVSHIINTECRADHHRTALVCKMAQEFDWFINSKKRWFCHFDDDNYVNIDGLVTFLQQYNHTDDWYLGRPSLSHPIEVVDRITNQKIAFWFATGGAGMCISRSLALKMVPHAGGGRLMKTASNIRLPDDCTIGYVINTLLNVELTVIKRFHSHLEALKKIRITDIKDQLTFGFALDKTKAVVDIPGFPEEKDPTRFWSIHCHLYPELKQCLTGEISHINITIA